MENFEFWSHLPAEIKLQILSWVLSESGFNLINKAINENLVHIDWSHVPTIENVAKSPFDPSEWKNLRLLSKDICRLISEDRFWRKFDCRFLFIPNKSKTKSPFGHFYDKTFQFIQSIFPRLTFQYKGVSKQKSLWLTEIGLCSGPNVLKSVLLKTETYRITVKESHQLTTQLETKKRKISDLNRKITVLNNGIEELNARLKSLSNKLLLDYNLY